MEQNLCLRVFAPCNGLLTEVVKASCTALTRRREPESLTAMGDWEERLFTLFDDLEQQAEAAFAAERDIEVADRALAEYAQVGMATRLMASVGREVVLRLSG